MSMTGMRTGMALADRRLAALRGPPTRKSLVNSILPSTTTPAFEVVPPMSRVTHVAMPSSSIRLLAAMTPATGPDSRLAIGRRRSSATSSPAPSEPMTTSGAVDPACLSPAAGGRCSG